MNKSFRGRLADGDIERIRLSTKQGLIGYKIIKFQLISNAPGSSSEEDLMKIYSINPGSSVDNKVDFSDPTLMAVNYNAINASGWYISEITIFDNTTVNQDIYIAFKKASAGSATCNYYLELEQVKLSKDEATVATLKDMRGRE